ncbi:hypothetical protein HanOQP8_Chr01g0008341 [Helianthus annuus]|nr:hypothetical protein HanOQP8_Chr01g0008341 [Helianthus annuus]
MFFQIPTINQENAVVASEPTETLVKFRSGKVLHPGQKGQGMVFFGHNMVCHDLHGKMIKVGDPVFVIKNFSSYDETSI